MEATVLENIKSDIELRPLFFELVSKGFVLGLSDTFAVSDNERVRLQRDYYDTLLDLTDKLQIKVKPNDVLDIVEEVSKYYLSHIGRISFESYKPSKEY